MDRNLSDRIRERAYHIWVANGCRDGEAEQHWFAAERELLSESSSAASATAVAARTPPKRSKPRKM